MELTLLASATGSGCRTARYGDFVIVTLPAAAFATTARELQIAENWARSRSSTGNPQRDRTQFFDRFENLLARNGSGIATKGNNQTLQKLVKQLEANGQQMNEWSVPTTLNDSVEVVKRKPAPDTTQPRAAPAEPAVAEVPKI